MAAVAHSPNVLIKISDLVAYDHNWTLDSLRELVLYCIDSFGPERGHVRQRFSGERVARHIRSNVWSLQTIVSEFSADEQRAIFFDNAKRTYRIDLECA
jgi:predicted TIM-barrel fold metal-dependent hydrolase